MLRLFTLIFLITIGFNKLFAESSLTKTTTTSFKPEIKLSLFIPGIIVEQKINKNFSAAFTVLEGFSFTYVSKKGESFSELNLYTYFSIEPRYYTIFRTLGAGNYSRVNGYFGLPIIYGIDESALITGIVYGFQRRFGKMGFLNFSLGYGMTKYSGKITGIPIGSLNFGIVIN